MKCVLMFDFDGVIADSLDVFYEEFSAVCRELRFDKVASRVDLLALFEDNFVRGLVKAGFPICRLRKLFRLFAPRIAQANRRVPPHPGMLELLGDLAGRFPVYIITSNMTEAILTFLATYKVAGIRDVLGGDQETSKVKKIRRVMRSYPGHTAYYVGDTKGDMREARTAGALPIGAAWGWHPVEKLREGEAERIVDSPGQLRALFLGESA